MLRTMLHCGKTNGTDRHPALGARPCLQHGRQTAAFSGEKGLPCLKLLGFNLNKMG
jgi:hypothetical protein